MGWVLGLTPYYNYKNGDVAQLGEHYTCTVGVVGSSPIISTTWSLKTGIKPPASVTGYDH